MTQRSMGGTNPTITGDSIIPNYAQVPFPGSITGVESFRQSDLRLSAGQIGGDNRYSYRRSPLW